MQAIQEYSNRFVEEREWQSFHTIKNLIMSLSIETGELMEVIQWLSDEETANLPQDLKKMGAIKEEIGDIFHCLVRICFSLDIDLEEAFWEKIKKTEKKYPVSLCYGKKLKYNEYSEISILS
jgi:NTP pyrophosphatase (non-canonical NTP hydrolase)